MSNRKFKSRKLAFAMLIPSLFVVFYVLADGIPTETTVVVVGKRQDNGGPITCTTGPCFDSAQAESARALQEWLQMYDPIRQDDLPLDEERFCQALGAGRPQGCSLSEPPASPGIIVPGQATWQPNGCGTEGLGSWFKTLFLNVWPDSLIRDI